MDGFLKGINAMNDGLMYILSFGHINNFKQYHRKTDAELRAEDAEKLRQDWQRVGDDLRNAIGYYEYKYDDKLNAKTVTQKK